MAGFMSGKRWITIVKWKEKKSQNALDPRIGIQVARGPLIYLRRVYYSNSKRNDTRVANFDLVKDPSMLCS
jgi:hypothetical protein